MREAEDLVAIDFELACVQPAAIDLGTVFMVDPEKFPAHVPLSHRRAMLHAYDPLLSEKDCIDELFDMEVALHMRIIFFTIVMTYVSDGYATSILTHVSEHITVFQIASESETVRKSVAELGISSYISSTEWKEEMSKHFEQKRLKEEKGK